jgi:hypothetical protein
MPVSERSFACPCSCALGAQRYWARLARSACAVGGVRWRSWVPKRAIRRGEVSVVPGAFFCPRCSDCRALAPGGCRGWRAHGVTGICGASIRGAMGR